jgi:hypothetical protein
LTSRSTCTGLLGAVCAALILHTTATEALATEGPVRRFALVIGNNRGNGADALLRYAERDATRMAEVLRRLGGVHPGDVELLLGEDAEAVEQAFQRLSQQITHHRGPGQRRHTLLFVFYSGHASGAGLHLGPDRLEFRRLRRLIGRSGAQLRILLLDACQSADAVRAKGGRQVAPFSLEHEALLGEGTAVITSGASGENAQESDRLQSGFFSHAILSGLQGAADTSGDGRVTLSEAYRYAYRETLRATSSAPELQHPTYAFELHGRDDLVLTRLDTPRGDTGALLFREPGTYVVFSGGQDGGLLAELQVSAPRRFALAPGTYVVRRRDARRVDEVTLRVAPGEVATIDRARLQPVGREPLAARGAGLARPWGISTATEIALDARPALLVAVGVQRRLGSYQLELGLRYGRPGEHEDLRTPAPAPGAPPEGTGSSGGSGRGSGEGTSNPPTAYGTDEQAAGRPHLFGGEAAVLRSFGSSVQLCPGLGANLNLVRHLQSSEPSDSWLAGAGPLVRAQWGGATWQLFVQLAAQWRLLAGAPDADAPWNTQARVGLMWQFR